MKEWLNENGMQLVVFVFLAGVIYSQVLENSERLKSREAAVDLVAVHEVRVNKNEKNIENITVQLSERNQEFINKLDDVLVRMDERDAIQSALVNQLAIDVSVLKERVSHGENN